MKCSKCSQDIGTEGKPAYQVRMGYVEDDGITFLPEEDVGYYCSECLSGGV